MSLLAANLDRIEGQLRDACERAERGRDEVTLVAVSKRQPLQAVEEAAVLGVGVFAENYAQALCERMKALPDLNWDYVGHVQSNKAKYLVPGVRLIHSLSTSSGAEALSRRAEREQVRTRVLVEVDTSDAGAATGPRTGASAAEACDLASRVVALPGLELRGLMAMPPPSEDPEDARPHFAQVRGMRDQLQDELGQPLPELSMGMSGDFEVAVEEGATLVRIGTALFGPRDAQ